MMSLQKIHPNKRCGKRKPHITDKKGKDLMSASVQDAAYIAVGTHQQHAIGENNVVIKFFQKMTYSVLFHCTTKTAPYAMPQKLLL